ncbi:MAG: hypothetical protein IJ927_01355, partial [Eubacterium sp.]|nr:hypothetical protein [Eubacterium sp.]
MKISEIRDLLDAKVLCCEDRIDREVYSACGCDLMSDVLAFVKDQAVLMTGLVNPQVIRTAVMMDMVCIVFVRSKTPTEEMLSLARDNGIVIMQSNKRLYEACGIM